MYVIEQMKLNKFRPRPIVSNRELFVANGAKPATVQSKDTADCYDSPTVEGASKTKLLGLAQDIIDQSEEFHNGGEPAKLKEPAKDK